MGGKQKPALRFCENITKPLQFERIRRESYKGARSVAEAKALITPRLFRAIGINAVRAAARLVRDNLGQSLLSVQENLANSHFFSRSHREEYFDTFCNMPNGFV